MKTPIEQLIPEIRTMVERDGEDIAAEDAKALFRWLDVNGGWKWHALISKAKGDNK